MATFLFPENATLQKIAQEKQAVLTKNDPIFSIMPIRNVDTPIVMWEQMDNYVGLQQLRGMGGPPQRVNKIGAKRFTLTPGYYGEFETIDEVEMLLRRPLGEYEGTVDIGSLVAVAQDKLASREVDLLRYIGWTLLTTGTFSVAHPTLGITHTDTFSLQTYDASTWGTLATATPMADLRAVQLLGRGKGVSFGAGATVYVNRVTANNLMNNANSADLAGKRLAGLASVIGLSDVNSVLIDQDLPQVVIYDEGYLNDSGTFVPFIANGKALVVGKRTDGGTVAEYLMTRNINTPNMAPGSYTAVIDRGAPGSGQTIPRTVEVHQGHNGGPVIYFPSALVIMDVS